MQTAAYNAYLLAKLDQYSKMFLDFTENMSTSQLNQLSLLLLVKFQADPEREYDIQNQKYPNILVFITQDRQLIT